MGFEEKLEMVRQGVPSLVRLVQLGRRASLLVLILLAVSTIAVTSLSSSVAYTSGHAPSASVLRIPSGSSSPSSPSSSNCSYTATVQGNWNDPTVWSPTPVAPFPNTVPAGCTVNIPAGITFTIPDGFKLTILGTIQNLGSLVINEFAQISNNGNGTINNDMNASIAASVGSTIDNNGGEINNIGGTITTNSGTVLNEGSGILNNSADGQFTLSNLAYFYNKLGSTVSNAGKITIQTNAVFLIQGGTVIISGLVLNKGMLEIGGNGTVTNLAGGTIENEFTIGNAGTINNVGSISNSGTINNNGTVSGSGSIKGNLIIPETYVSCSPASISVNSPSDCVVRILGAMDSTNGEAISFASNSSTGSFSPSPSCVLSSGSCSATYKDSTAGGPVITAAYPGDSSDGASSGNTTITVTPSATSTASSSSSSSTAISQSNTTLITTTTTSSTSTTPTSTSTSSTSSTMALATSTSTSTTSTKSTATSAPSTTTSTPSSSELSSSYLTGVVLTAAIVVITFFIVRTRARKPRSA